MNKKFLYLLPLLLFLMLMINGFKYLFMDNIKQVAIDNNVEGFNDYLLSVGNHKVTLPIGWTLKENSSSEEDINILFSDGNNINGNIRIVNGKLEDYLKEYKDTSVRTVKLEGANYNWSIIDKDEKDKMIKYYLTQYSEGKVLIVKYSYENGKVKNSMKIVFDKVSDGFK